MPNARKCLILFIAVSFSPIFWVFQASKLLVILQWRKSPHFTELKNFDSLIHVVDKVLDKILGVQLEIYSNI